MKSQKESSLLCAPMDYSRMIEHLNALDEQYAALDVTFLGESVLGRSIPLITLGKGSKAVLYVGAHNADEGITTSILLRFIEELLSIGEREGRIFQYSLPYLMATRKLYIIPMLNPDGVEYRQNGIAKDHILYDRVCSMNGGHDDLRTWQANARGVELARNYPYGFASYKKQEVALGISGGPCNFSGEMPESEPEIAALCKFLRYHQDIGTTLSLHTGKERVVAGDSGQMSARSMAVGKAISRMTGYPLEFYRTGDAVGGMSAWCIDECNVPSFSLSCGDASLSPNETFRLYTVLRETLFTVPTMISV